MCIVIKWLKIKYLSLSINIDGRFPLRWSIIWPKLREICVILDQIFIPEIWNYRENEIRCKGTICIYPSLAQTFHFEQSFCLFLFILSYRPLYFCMSFPPCLLAFLHSVFLLACMPTFLWVRLTTELFVCLSVRLPACLAVYLPACLFSVFLSVSLSFYCLSFCLSVRLSVCLSICVFVRLSFCPSVFLSVCLSVFLAY